MITIQCKARFQKGRRRGETETEGEDLPQECPGRVPRVARLMALAIRFEQMIRDGEVSGYAELARRGHVSRARVTQIMNLLVLAPDIQEQVLMLQPSLKGRDLVSEHDLRTIARTTCWKVQRIQFNRIVASEL